MNGPTTRLGTDPAAMFAAGPPKFPRRKLWMILSVAAVLGIGGAFADHSFNVTPAVTLAPTVRHTAGQRETIAQFVGLRSLGGRSAPAIDLTDARGTGFSLTRLSGQITLLTFLSPNCTGPCPVVAAELRQAEVDLAKVHLRPALVIVNADPERLSTISVRTTLRQGLTAALPGATFLTASLGRIQTVWKRYGVTVELDPTTHALAYTNVLYVIGPTGKLRDALTPFANESLSGRATLPKTEIDRFARGIAIAVQSVAR